MSGRRWLNHGAVYTLGAGGVRYGSPLRQRKAPASAYAFRACAAVTGLLLCRLTAGHTEAQRVEAVRRVEAVARRRPAVVRVEPPAAAATHAVGALCGANRIGAARKFCTIAIRAPLPHVTVHVMQAPWVWFLQANRVSVFFASIESVAMGAGRRGLNFFA